MDELLTSNVCTLPTSERPLRLGELDDLLRRAVVDVQRGPGEVRLLLRGAAGLRDEVADLTAREAQCCSFFTFLLSEDDRGDLSLAVRVPTAQAAVLEGLARRAEELSA